MGFNGIYAKLVEITPVSLWFTVLRTIVFMGFLKQRSHNCGGPMIPMGPVLRLCGAQQAALML